MRDHRVLSCAEREIWKIINATTLVHFCPWIVLFHFLVLAILCYFVNALIHIHTETSTPFYAYVVVKFLLSQ
jgi:hypothetical protein